MYKRQKLGTFFNNHINFVPEKYGAIGKPVLSLNLSILKCDFKNLITKDFYIIQTLIALCPVLGLLGTVTGMIEVFDVVSFFGTGNARALASGITKATLPTMTGMAISIVGLLTYTVLNSKSQSLISEL